jgi:hypothetical protein
MERITRIARICWVEGQKEQVKDIDNDGTK